LVPHSYNKNTLWDFNAPEGGKYLSCDLNIEHDFDKDISKVLDDHNKGEYDLGNFALIE
jgi:hypothetical protein